ncbi:protein NEGATIVE REGULATOR OF RESISTANCE-like [Curcuma longa]|uniref:protein NEGATIVE REGULATOR OF RESISTANCE-like n=1 Tax=Curcuma longa TaxID=136217 RepID=UPI003D9E23B5
MERSGRKRRGARYCQGRLPSRLRPDEVAPPAANDDEVEEFFTILRQMRDASRRLAAGQRTVVVGDGSTRWNPEFSLEDFACGPDGVKSDRSSTSVSVPAAEEQPAEIVAPRSLDLNVDPEPEG